LVLTETELLAIFVHYYLFT